MLLSSVTAVGAGATCSRMAHPQAIATRLADHSRSTETRPDLDRVVTNSAVCHRPEVSIPTCRVWSQDVLSPDYQEVFGRPTGIRLPRFTY